MTPAGTQLSFRYFDSLNPSDRLFKSKNKWQIYYVGVEHYLKFIFNLKKDDKSGWMENFKEIKVISSHSVNKPFIAFPAYTRNCFSIHEVMSKYFGCHKIAFMSHKSDNIIFNAISRFHLPTAVIISYCLL